GIFWFYYRRPGDDSTRKEAFTSPIFSDILAISPKIFVLISYGGFMIVSKAAFSMKFVEALYCPPKLKLGKKQKP
uniref:hypothetical protein n=1 Tax=Roseivirga sp. TaxID=1964215 RepID=UPI00404777A6